MDGVVLSLFLLTTFFGGVVTGLAGFAMGLVVSGVWLHILTPAETAALIVGYGILTQSYNIWRLRHALNWRIVAPFIAGGAVGYGIAVAMDVKTPGLAREQAEKLVHAAHQVCPYSNATRGNVDVKLNVVD